MDLGSLFVPGVVAAMLLFITVLGGVALFVRAR